MARASQGKLPRRLEEYSSDAPKGASEPAQSLSRLSLDRATVIPLDQASFLLSGPCQSPSRSPRGLWVMAFDWLPECICSLCLNLAGGMRPRISKGVIQAGLSHSGHDRNPLGRKSQMLGRKEANRSFPSETAFSSIFPQTGYSPSCQPPNGRIRANTSGSLLPYHLSSLWETHWGPYLNHWPSSYPWYQMAKDYEEGIRPRKDTDCPPKILSFKKNNIPKQRAYSIRPIAA